MTKNIQTILMPFLIINYMFGLRIINLSNYVKLCFNVLYILLVWLIYYFLSTSSLIISFDKLHPIEDYICFWLEIFLTLLSIIFGIYYNKKFWNCLRKFDIVDNTLLELGTVTDYDKLHMKTLWIIFGWAMITILWNSSTALYIRNEYNCTVVTATLYIFIRNYCFHINFIGDLTTASILNYTGIKFDQVNEHLQSLIKNNKHKIKQAWKNTMIHPHQRRFSRALSRKCIMWIVIHLHFELRKISNEINLIFGTQMTFKMASYFCWLAIDLREILYPILISNYVKFSITNSTLHFLWFSHNVFKIMLINYMCETVTAKANATADSLNRLSYFSCDIEDREMISQFSIRAIKAPLRFCGIGFFQFGYEFLYRFIMSVATVLVILIQAHND